MRAVIQAVSSASVRVEGGEPRAIGPGIMILLGVRDTDTLDIVPKLADKCAGLRIFPDAEGKLNLSARDLGYSALVVSQFTLYGDTKKGYRPSFIKAAKPPLSVDAYELFLAEMAKHGLKDVQHGEFGAHMQVSLVNEGPCTIVIDTDEWKKPGGIALYLDDVLAAAGRLFAAGVLDQRHAGSAVARNAQQIHQTNGSTCLDVVDDNTVLNLVNIQHISSPPSVLWGLQAPAGS